MDTNKTPERIYKAAWDKQILPEICGAANGDGAVFVIGRENADAPSSIDRGEVSRLLKVIPGKIVEAMGYYDFSVDAEGGDWGECVVVTVEKSGNGDVLCNGKRYKRIGQTNFLVESGGAKTNVTTCTWDSALVCGVTVEDLDAGEVKRFEELSGTTLEGLGLVRHGNPTIAAALLFLPNPRDIFPGAYVQIGKVGSKGDVKMKDEISAPLFRLGDVVQETLKTKYLTTRGAKYSSAALTEAIANAVMHTDWSAGQCISISVFDHSICITNRSNLPAGWMVGKIRPRFTNPMICSAFGRSRKAELFGTGMPKMVNECVSAGLPEPLFEATFDGLDFAVTFRSASFAAAIAACQGTGSVGVAGNVEAVNSRGVELSSIADKGGAVLQRRRKILALMAADPDATTRGLSVTAGIPIATLNRDLAWLKENGYLSRDGSRKTGKWVAQTGKL